MKKYIFIVFAVLVIPCCKSLKVDSPLGKYYASGNDFKYFLDLRADNTFALEFHYQNAKPKCQGNWSLVSNKIILLKCKELEAIEDQLSSDYLNKKEYELEIINRKKLRLANVVMRKR